MTEFVSGLDPVHNSEEVYSDELFVEEGSSEYEAPEIPAHKGVDF